MKSVERKGVEPPSQPPTHSHVVLTKQGERRILNGAGKAGTIWRVQSFTKRRRTRAVAHNRGSSRQRGDKAMKQPNADAIRAYMASQGRKGGKRL